MKSVIIILIFISGLAQAQSPSLKELMPGVSDTQLSSADARISSLVEKLAQEKQTSELRFLKKVFSKTERTLLLEYEPYAAFSGIFEKGKFDCLTATTLFSMVLDQLHVSFHIIETNYHIFLLIPTNKGNVLFETTDRIRGFITDPQEIAERISAYQNIDPSERCAGKVAYQYQHSHFQDVNPAELAGLLFFNQSVKAYNAGDFERCADLLEKAQTRCHSTRVDELTTILIRTVESGKLSAPVKKYLLEKIRVLSAMKGTQMASR